LRSPLKDCCYRRHCRGAVAASAIAAVALLAACSWIPFVGKKSESAVMPACPVAAILRPLANTVVFGPGAEQKPLYVSWNGIFSDISANCRIDGDTLHASLDNVIVAERGPGGHSNDVDFNYFVALTVAFSTGGRPLSDLNIIVGFQLSPDTVQFYKNYRGRQ
jgi:hypothetical protein